MKHLTDAELIDVLDLVAADTGPSGPAAQHVVECELCREKLTMLREAVAHVESDAVPEPSPLFWDHFSTRVNAAIDEGIAAHSGRGAWLTPPRGWAIAAASLVIALVAGLWQWSAPTFPVRPGNSSAGVDRAAAAAVTAIDVSDDLEAIDSDEAWAIVRTVADDVEWDDDAATAGLFARPGWAERAAQTLTTDEREQLLELLQAATPAAPRIPGA